MPRNLLPKEHGFHCSLLPISNNSRFSTNGIRTCNSLNGNHSTVKKINFSGPKQTWSHAFMSLSEVGGGKNPIMSETSVCVYIFQLCCRLWIIQTIIQEQPHLDPKLHSFLSRLLQQNLKMKNILATKMWLCWNLGETAKTTAPSLLSQVEKRIRCMIP